MADQHEIVVIGGGIVGLGTAMALVSAGRSVLVLEAEDRVAAHQTGNNSGVIHSGLYYKPGSLKAQLCREGREAMYQFCDEHGVAHERCGKVVVAVDESELPALDELIRRGSANGLANLRRLPIEEIREREPHVSGIAGIHVAETGIVNFTQVAAAYTRVIQAAGGEVRTGSRLIGVRVMPDELVLTTSRDEVRCKTLVNCAGLQSDRIARMCGVQPGVRIVPFRGEYYKLTPDAHTLCRNLIYPVPDPAFPFLGVHFTRMALGGVEAGPNAVLALSRHGYSWGRISPRDVAEVFGFPGFWKMASRYWRAGAGEVRRSLSRGAFLRALQRLMPELEMRHLAPGGAGVRAQALDPSGKLVDDFRIQLAPRMVHVLNAPSPACTASLAIGKYIAREVSKLS